MRDSSAPEGYRTLAGEPVRRLDFSSVSEADSFLEKMENAAGAKVYGLSNWPYLFIHERYPGEVEWDEQLIRRGSLDVEVESDKGFPDPAKAEAPIVSIAVRYRGRIAAFGLKPCDLGRDDVDFFKFSDEASLLRGFLKFWKILDLDVVTGWNLEYFDVPYLVNRICRVLSQSEARTLSPWGIVREINDTDGTVTYDLLGLFIADYLLIYKKFSFKAHESYQLGRIAEDVLKRGKLDFGSHKSFKSLYDGDYPRFITYNCRDCELVDWLEDELGLLSLMYARAYLSKINYADCMGTVKPWDALIHSYLMDELGGVVVPPQGENYLDRPLIGGHVKEAARGMHSWVAGMDVKSEYPHVIMQWNISPETLLDGGELERLSVEERIEKYASGCAPDLGGGGYCVAANGLRYRTDVVGFLPALMRKLYDARVEAQASLKAAKKRLELPDLSEDERAALERRKTRVHNLQRAYKDTLNSGYGALANVYNRWFNFGMAESVTSTGQLVIRTAENAANDRANEEFGTSGRDYVVAVDTDSVYLACSGAAENRAGDALDAVRSFAGEVGGSIRAAHDALAERMGCRTNEIRMNLETVSSRAVWTATKRYILNVVEDDGIALREPSLKMKGVEAVRSDTPKAVRSAIKRALQIVMNGDEEELDNFAAEFYEKFLELPFEEVAFSKSVNNLAKWADPDTVYKKGTPFHVKGALLYNYLLEEHGLCSEYPKIRDRDKVKIAYVRQPNPVQCSAIATTHDLPTAFGLDDYVDRDTQFDKAFVNPLMSVLDHVGWSVRGVSSTEAPSVLKLMR